MSNVKIEVGNSKSSPFRNRSFSFCVDRSRFIKSPASSCSPDETASYTKFGKLKEMILSNKQNSLLNSLDPCYRQTEQQLIGN